MSDKGASPRHARDEPSPPHMKRRNDARSQSPPRSVEDRADGHRRRDDYRSRNDDDRPRASRDNWRDRRNHDDDKSNRRYGTREDDRSERRDRNRDSDERRDRDRPRPKKSFGGIKYKEKRRDDDDDRDGNRRGDSYRGYRNRSPSPRRRNYDRDEPSSSSSKNTKKKSAETDTSKPPSRAPAAPVASGEEMIIVHVNDRLGTKAAIPCFASDHIKEFKIMVAARIGREPHEILLKRQGQRPFKDMLTLADYEISNGVQLDLEVDTGD
ncbi:ubiquitin-related domain-containing protein [Xylaria bambusicola]|uniref:ubiquitin-related domain-containing protein n=1 Tax=Xylaria bambusicola TaxID=326684 RepID=UPI002007720B|nr:ubiquitin-related domain-containing protein [Xylaria bambusicola]KAI0502827.1 ubiquitin-related domain-containing protein [Xylaria bambusicola]